MIIPSARLARDPVSEDRGRRKKRKRKEGRKKEKEKRGGLKEGWDKGKTARRPTDTFKLLD